jgi:spermidine/putrescine transport system ATP-binding protein
MAETVVELRRVTKIFDSRRGTEEERVVAVRDMDLKLHRGEFFTLLGPSGCGKTTTLRLIAGFEAPTEGEIMIEGQPMHSVAPNRRPVNTVFQNYALFPHLNVEQNVGFGLAVRRTPRAQRARLVREALEMVQLPGMQHRKPSQLSGGQQQRVALARALVNRPTVLLLDEPLGALDFKLRKAMQIELKHLQEQVGITFIYVTHDQEEALTMSDRIAVMDRGLVQQVGDPVSLYEKPANRFVADFIGESNFIQCIVRSIEAGKACLSLNDEEVLARLGEKPPRLGERITLAIRPERICMLPLDADMPGALLAEVQEAVFVGPHKTYLMSLRSGQEIVVRVQNVGEAAGPEFRIGEKAKIYWNPSDSRLLLS